MGGGGGTQNSTSTTSIDPDIKPYVTYGLEQAKNLYQSGTPSFYPGQTYVDPSGQTTDALQLAEARARKGSALNTDAQNVISNQLSYNNPYANKISSVGGAAADPSAEFYRLMMQGQPDSEAMNFTRKTASGSYLEPSPYLQGSLSQANRLSSEAYQEGLRGLQSQASASGRYGSGAAGQQVAKGQDVFARAIAEQNQKAYLDNYNNERIAQENAIKNLGSFEQQQIANRFSGATNLTSGEQKALDTKLSSYGNAATLVNADLTRQQQAAKLAPEMANLDYADIQKLLNVGGSYEKQSGNVLQDAMNRYNFGENLPQMKLSQFANLFSNVPQGGNVTSTATPQGGK